MNVLKRRTPWAFDVLFLAAVGAGLFSAVSHRQQIGDWWFFRSYRPSEEVVKLADDTGLNPSGRRLFYRGNPQFVDQDTLSQRCALENLGCITEAGQIYILRVEGNPYYGQAVVTAAHETLHVAYRRLGREKQAVNELLKIEIDRLQDQDLNDALKRTADDEEYYDEAHSILGSEYPNLLPETEEYYSRYFDDRDKAAAGAAR